MANKYEGKTIPQLTKILKSRSLPLKGKKADLVQRLLDADEAHAARTGQLEEEPPQNDGRPTVPDLPDFYALVPDFFLLYSSNIHGRNEKIQRIQKALIRSNIEFALKDVEHSWIFNVLWRKIAHGRELPALMKRARVIGDFVQLQEWIESGDLKTRVDEASENAHVNFPEPEPEIPGRHEDIPIIPGIGPNYAGYIIPPWANIPPPIPNPQSGENDDGLQNQLSQKEFLSPED